MRIKLWANIGSKMSLIPDQLKWLNAFPLTKSKTTKIIFVTFESFSNQLLSDLCSFDTLRGRGNKPIPWA